MKIVALLTVRNEALYIRQCLEHLISQGVEVCLIDNDSEDDTIKIARKYLNKGLLCIERLPYQGCFELKRILKNEESLSYELGADWYIHHDADEIRETPSYLKTLNEGFTEVDAAGFNAINFNEFVFLPTADDETSYAGKNFKEEMSYYYFFEPNPFRQVKAWKNFGQEIDLSSTGGHHVQFENIRIYPEPFILRHYISLSRAQIIAKYSGRTFAASEIHEDGWHGGRANFSPSRLKLPNKSELKKLKNGQFDTSEPWTRHVFLGDEKVRKVDQLERLTQLRDVKTAPKNPLLSALQRTFLRRKEWPVPYVVGVMRSGTTLLRLMLDAHPELSIPPETRFFPGIEHMLTKPVVASKDVTDIICSIPTWPDFGIDKHDFEIELNKIRDLSLAKALNVFYGMYAKKHGKSRWGDKTPYYDNHMDQIQLLFPNARFIHLIRDGRDVVSSTHNLWFGLGDSVAEEAGNWVSRIRQTRQLAQLLPNYMEIKYEALIIEPKEQLMKICDFIELKFHPKMLRYYENTADRLSEFRPRYDQAGNEILTREKRIESFRQTFEPPNRDRIGRWKEHLSPKQKKEFHAIAGEFLEELGYEV